MERVLGPLPVDRAEFTEARHASVARTVLDGDHRRDVRGDVDRIVDVGHEIDDVAIRGDYGVRHSKHPTRAVRQSCVIG